MENKESKTPKTNTPKTSTMGKASSKPAAPTKTAASNTPGKPATIKPTASSKPVASPKVTTSAVNSVATKPVTKTSPTASGINPTKTFTPATNTKPLATRSTSIVSSKKASSKLEVKKIAKEDLDKNLIAEDTEEEKKKKKKFILIIIFFIIGLILIGTAIYFITKIPRSDVNFSVEIVADLDVTFEDEFGQIRYYNYYPGDILKGKLNINIDDLDNVVSGEEYVFLRFKVSVEIDGNYYAGVFEPIFNKPNEWYGNGADDFGTTSSSTNLEYSADNYYYYCGKCYDGTEIKPFDYLNFTTDGNNNIFKGKTGKLIFYVEILEGNYSAISQEWYTAPDGWRNNVNIR